MLQPLSSLTTSVAPARVSSAGAAPPQEKLPQDQLTLTGAAPVAQAPAAAPAPTPAAAPPPAAKAAALAPVPTRLQADEAPDVSAALATAFSAIDKAASPDGVWRTPYLAGPFQEVISSLGLHFVGVKDEQFVKEERSLYDQMLSQQKPDGSFVPSDGLPSSPAITKLVCLGLRQVMKDLPEADKARFQEAHDKAQAYLKTTRDKDVNFMLPGMVDLVHEVMEPTGGGFPWLVNPFGLRKVDTLMSTRIGQMVAGQLCGVVPGMMPALGILSEHVWDTKQRSPIMQRIHDAVFHPEPRLARMEKAVLDKQDVNGSWILVGMATSLNLMAMKARGYDLDDPEVKKGVDFIRQHRKTDEAGETKQWWCNAELWDSCVAADLLLSNGTRASDPRLKKVIDMALQEQADDGRWAFAVGSKKVAETDSSSIVLRYLAKCYPTADEAQKPAIKAAVQKGVEGMLEHQQRDGGWNAWDDTSFTWGSRVPGPAEAFALDPATPDVTGRVLWALASAEQNGLLTEDQKPRYSESVEKAMEYYQGSQTENGSWWARWITGYQASPTFVLMSMRTAGQDMSQPWIQESRSIFLDNQNADGGFGETVDADTDASRAGRGPSTPVQTAFGIVSLLASSTTEDVKNDPVLRKAVDYLKSTQQSDGTWTNGKPLYTVGPGSEYYDAPFMTHCMAASALLLYDRCCEMGVSRAFASSLQPHKDL